VVAAVGGRDSAVRDAEARERLAQAEANATRMVAEAAAGSGGDALRYFVAEKYVKAFEALASNPSSKLVVVPMESASLAGGIAQAMELLRAPGAAPAAPPAPSAGGSSPWNRG
jgi:regulator of protease activity HflC (stomatin/prohibitin superfamily)